MMRIRLGTSRRLIEVLRIKGVPVIAHWSLFLIGGVILLGARHDPGIAFAILSAYYGVILLHECGHMFAAQRKRCPVWSIELYPFWGFTRYEPPYSQRDRCLIAWGGVAAQGLLALPIIGWVGAFGFTRFQMLNAFFAITGYYSLFVAAYNLLPFEPLDGAIAWKLLPSLFGRPAAKSSRREPGWRSWRT